MSTIRIRIGASMDRSVDVVFANIEKRSKRAGDTINNNLSGRNRGPYRTAAREADRAYRKVGDSAKRAAREAQRATEKSLAAQARAYKQLGNVAARELARTTRAQQRTAASDGRSFARRVSHRTTRFLTPNAPIASFASRAGRDILRGAGVNFDVGSSVSRAVDLEQSALNLSNAGFQRGAKGPAGIRQDPRTIISDARRVADETAISPNAAVEGVGEFVGKTGDLATGRAVMKDLAILSKATGANMSEMVSAAGDVGAALGDAAGSQEEAEARAGKIASIMRVIAGQGKLGAVEIKDLATQMAKVSTSATSFEGNVEQNIATMGALTQLARGKGGAVSASVAATATANFVNTLKTPARMKAFKAAGVNVEGKNGLLRDPQQIIIDSLHATASDTAKFKGLYANIRGEKAVSGLRQTYLSAGGGAAGEQAVRAKFQELGAGAAITKGEQNDSFQRAMGLSSSKAQKFNNNLDAIVSSMADKLLPAMEKLGPSALQLASTLGSVSTWVAENPKKAITMAISASIARAMGESILRSGIERMILGPNGGAGGVGGLGAPGGGRAGKIGSAAAGLGAGLTIAATAVTITAMGMVAIDAVGDVAAETQRRNIEGQIGTQNLISASRDGTLTKGQVAEAAAQLAERQRRLKAAQDLNDGTVMGTVGNSVAFPFKALAGLLTGEMSTGQIAQQVGDTNNIDTLQTEISELKRIMSRVENKTMRVIVTNPEDIKQDAPAVDPQKQFMNPYLQP